MTGDCSCADTASRDLDLDTAAVAALVRGRWPPHSSRCLGPVRPATSAASRHRPGARARQLETWTEHLALPGRSRTRPVHPRRRGARDTDAAGGSASPSHHSLGPDSDPMNRPACCSALTRLHGAFPYASGRDPPRVRNVWSGSGRTRIAAAQAAGPNRRPARSDSSPTDAAGRATTRRSAISRIPGTQAGGGQRVKAKAHLLPVHSAAGNSPSVLVHDTCNPSLKEAMTIASFLS